MPRPKDASICYTNLGFSQIWSRGASGMFAVDVWLIGDLELPEPRVRECRLDHSDGDLAVGELRSSNIYASLDAAWNVGDLYSAWT